MLHLKHWSSLIGSVRKLTTMVDKSSLSKLRKKTGFPFINCKNALVQFDNDLIRAEEWLREQAQKEGWSKATKLQSRPMSQGLIGIISDQNNTAATLIEVNCETDFVARNEKFVSLVGSLAAACNNHFNTMTGKKIYLEKQEVNSILTAEGRTVGDMVAYEVGNIGENMLLRRAVHLVTSATSSLSTYVHVSGPEIMASNNCRLGKYGTIMELQRLPNEDKTNFLVADPFNISQQICQHIVGMNPKTVGTSDGQSSAEQPSSKEQTLNKEEESRLIFQEFLTDSSVLVGDVLKENCLLVKDFVRFECGETLPGED